MKKFTAFMLIFSLLATSLLFTGCNKEEDLSSKIANKTQAYRTDLEDSAETLKTEKDVRQYLCNWAKSKGISFSYDTANNVIMTRAAGKAYKKSKPVVIICPYDDTQFSNNIDSVAMALYIARNNESTGKLTVIFTKENGHDFSGIKTLNSKYFPDNANVFCLNSGDKPVWSVNSGGYSSFVFKNSVQYKVPTGHTAYKITISGLPGGIPDSKISKYPNPIKELGDLLAKFKTNAMIYELSKIKGGSSGNLYPKSASATIVIDDDDNDKFVGKLDKAIEKFTADNKDDYPDMTFTYRKVRVPSKVLTDSDLNKFVSILYSSTVVNGVYNRNDDDEVMSVTNIGNISFSGNECRIKASGYSLNKSSLAEISTSYKTICGLSDVKFIRTDYQEPWESDAASDFANEVADAFHSYSGKDMEYRNCVSATNANYVYKINNKCNIMNVVVNQEKLERYTGTLVTFMLNQEHNDKQQS